MEAPRTRTSTRPPPFHSAAPCPYTFADHPQKPYPCKDREGRPGNHSRTLLIDTIAADSLLIQFHAQPWSLRQLHAASLIKGQRFLEKVGAKRIRVLIPFEPTAIGDRGDEVHVGNCAHRRCEDVGDDGQTIGLRKRRDFAALGDAARPDHIWLDDIDGVARDKLAKAG